ncbi:MAG TPA: TldD/PmbA family protein [Spirochaetota bacterium]|nr:TldD/PmbA family protein [Spirochaetota bacterium]
MIERVTKTMPGGTRWFDIIHVSGRSTPVKFKNNRLHSLTENENSGTGVRLNIDGHTGFSSTNDDSNIERIAKLAASLSKFGDIENFTLPADTKSLFDPYDPEIENFNLQNEISACEASIDELTRRFPGISIDMGVTASTGSLRLANSEGIDISYRDSYYSASVSATLVLEDGTRIETWEGESHTKPVEFREMAGVVADKIEKALTARKIESGMYPVILPPSAFGSLLGLVISGFSAVPVWKGISPMAEKQGTRVFSEKLTVKDTPVITGSPYSIPFDAEGVNVADKFLVNSGVVETFIADLKYAERLGIAPTGNASRGYSSLPGPSFTGIEVNPGSETHESIISAIKKGIVAHQFIGLGQSNTITGDFSASMDLAYLVEDGKITGRVKDCMISGNIIQLLAGGIELSSDRERKGSSILPWLWLPQVNITG